jgi:hypothetical protein
VRAKRARPYRASEASAAHRASEASAALPCERSERGLFQAEGLSCHPCSFRRSPYARAQFSASHSSWNSSVRTTSRSWTTWTSTGVPLGYRMQRTSVVRRRRHHNMRAPGWTENVDTFGGAPLLAPTAIDIGSTCDLSGRRRERQARLLIGRHSRVSAVTSSFNNPYFRISR